MNPDTFKSKLVDAGFSKIEWNKVDVFTSDQVVVVVPNNRYKTIVGVSDLSNDKYLFENECVEKNIGSLDQYVLPDAKGGIRASFITHLDEKYSRAGVHVETETQAKNILDWILEKDGKTGFASLKSSAEGTSTDHYDFEERRKERDKVLKTIVSGRKGQTNFRKKLIEANKAAQCCFTGTVIPEIIEAAHIVPYLSEDDNHIENGLLLRADIHSLFDANLLAGR